jgi:hypothetical protein
MKLLFSIVALSVTIVAVVAQSGSEGVQGYSDNWSAVIDTTAGWTFQPSKTVTITALGCFAKIFDDNPNVTLIQVGLWNDSGSQMLSNAVSPRSPLRNQSRYEPVTEVTLTPGQIYHLGAYYPGGSVGFDLAGALVGGTVTTSAEIGLRATALAVAGFAFPDEQAGTSGSIYAGPNFLFQDQPRLRLQLWSARRVRLSWPAAYSGYALQSSSRLSGGWASSGLAVTVVGNEYVAFDTIGSVQKYYRLMK